MCDMEWNNSNIIKFLELYKNHSLFWDTKNVWHKNKNRLSQAWLEIQREMGDSFSVQELRKKKESLMSMYRKCRTKIRKSELEGKDVYEPTWFAYPLMDSFLGSVYKCSLSVKDEDKSMADSIYVNNNSSGSCSEVESDPLKHQEMATPKAFKRKHFLTQTTKQPRVLNSTTSKAVPPEVSNGKGDECLLFSKLVAVKLRKMPEERRDFIMLKINEIFYNESQERYTLNS